MLRQHKKDQTEERIERVVKVFKGLKKDKAATTNWPDNIQALKDRVNNKELIKELKRFGKLAALEIAALCTLTDDQLKEFYTLLQGKMKNPGEGRLFTTVDGRPMHPDTVTSWFHDFLEQAVIHKTCGKAVGSATECPHCKKPVKAEDIIKLPPLPFHGLQHTAATMLINQNIPLKNIAGRLGHADIRTTGNIYSHYLQSADKAIADTLENVHQKIKGQA